MKTKTFIFFIFPSILMMLLFIAFPLVSVFVQSFYVTSNVFQTVEEEVCTPSFTQQICRTEKIKKTILDDQGEPRTQTRFVGFETYRIILGVESLKEFLNNPSNQFIDLIDELSYVDFYKALRFTLTFTLVTLPFVIIIGLLLALSVDKLFRFLKGPFIFIYLLPFIITPVIGAISIKWLFIGDGILTVFLEYILEKDIAVFAHGWSIELLMLFYRVWHVAPFAFVVFYAGLQTVEQDILDAAVVDGATRFQKLIYVIIPHLSPLIIFVSLIHLMDAFRVFEEVIGFSSEAYRISLQWLTYDFLTPDDSGNRAISRASASSMLTMIGIIILLIPMLIKTWKENRTIR